jgi:hypothetical protein
MKGMPTMPSLFKSCWKVAVRSTGGELENVVDLGRGY